MHCFCRNGAVPVVLPDMRMPQVLVELTSKRCVDSDAVALLAYPPLSCSLLFNLIRCHSDFRMQLRLPAGGGC